MMTMTRKDETHTSMRETAHPPCIVPFRLTISGPAGDAYGTRDKDMGFAGGEREGGVTIWVR